MVHMLVKKLIQVLVLVNLTNKKYLSANKRHVIKSHTKKKKKKHINNFARE